MFLCAISSLEAWAEPGTPEGALRRYLWLAAHEIAASDEGERPRGVIKAGRKLSNILTIAALEVHPARLAALLAEAEYEFANAMLQNLRMRDRRKTGINRRAPLARWGQ
jgi:hypothetical protein